MFLIDKHTGVLYTSAQQLDRETVPLYNVTVVATDSGGNKVSAILANLMRSRA